MEKTLTLPHTKYKQIHPTKTNGTVSGPGGITAELLKHGIQKSIELLVKYYSIPNWIYHRRRMGISIHNINLQKGDKDKLENY